MSRNHPPLRRPRVQARCRHERGRRPSSPSQPAYHSSRSRLLSPGALARSLRWRPKVSAACRQLPRRCTAERRIRARPSVNAHPDMSARARAPPPGSPGATTDTDRPHRRRGAPDEPSAALEWSLDGTSFSGSSSITPTTPSGPGRPFRLARVPRPGMTNTDVRLGIHPPDQTRQGPPYARSTTSRMLSRTNAHAYNRYR